MKQDQQIADKWVWIKRQKLWNKRTKKATNSKILLKCWTNSLESNENHDRVEKFLIRVIALFSIYKKLRIKKLVTKVKYRNINTSSSEQCLKSRDIVFKNFFNFESNVCLWKKNLPIW